MPTRKIPAVNETSDSAEPVLLHENLPHYGEHDQQRRRWMWFGVVTFAILIVGLWGWALRLRVSIFDWRLSQEFNLVNRAKGDWNTISNQTQSTELQDELGKMKVRSALSQLIATQAAAAPVPANTEPTTSTGSATTSLPTSTKQFPMAKPTKK